MRASARSKFFSCGRRAVITCKRLASRFPLKSQPPIKSILRLESGQTLEYASIRLGLSYGLRFIAAARSKSNDVRTTELITFVPRSPNIWRWCAAGGRPYKGDGRHNEAGASLVGD